MWPTTAGISKDFANLSTLPRRSVMLHSHHNQICITVESSPAKPWLSAANHACKPRQSTAPCISRPTSTRRLGRHIHTLTPTAHTFDFVKLKKSFRRSVYKHIKEETHVETSTKIPTKAVVPGIAQHPKRASTDESTSYGCKTFVLSPKTSYNKIGGGVRRLRRGRRSAYARGSESGGEERDNSKLHGDSCYKVMKW